MTFSNHDPVTLDSVTEIIGEPDQALLEAHGLLEMLRIWKGWAGTAFAPTWKNIDLFGMPEELRRGTMVVDYLPETQDFTVRFWGTELVDAFGIELTGKLLSAKQDRGIMSSFRDSAMTVVENRAPQALLHKIRSTMGIERLYPVVRLPISDDGETVTKIMTVENIGLCMQSYFHNRVS